MQADQKGGDCDISILGLCKEPFWSLHFQWSFPITENDHWEQSEPKRLQLRIIFKKKTTLLPKKGLGFMEGSIGEDKKLASNQEVLGSTNLGVPMCYIMLHDLRCCKNICGKVQHHKQRSIAKKFTQKLECTEQSNQSISSTSSVQVTSQCVVIAPLAHDQQRLIKPIL
jgi:hypothetical protein